MLYQPLKGQKALVTGASSGIGRGVALALDVVVNYASDPEAAGEVVDEIKKGGSNARAIRADVSREMEGDDEHAGFRTGDLRGSRGGGITRVALHQWRRRLRVGHG